jgi:hypothetical protein
MNGVVCSECGGCGLVEAPAWYWQSDRWKPCPNGCDPPPLKDRTTYECLNPACGKGSLFTGDISTRRRPGDHVCSCCGEPYVELVIDGTRWKVEWEMQGPYSEGAWHLTSRETESRKSALDQHAQLSEWERTGDEPVRSVKLYRSIVAWEEVTLDEPAAGAVSPQGTP